MLFRTVRPVPEIQLCGFTLYDGVPSVWHDHDKEVAALQYLAHDSARARPRGNQHRRRRRTATPSTIRVPLGRLVVAFVMHQAREAVVVSIYCAR